jgi:hypothetical protein
MRGLLLRVTDRLRPEAALSLASLRVVVPLLVLVSPGMRNAESVASYDPARWIVPEGLGWFVAHVPIDPKLVTAAKLVAAFAAFAAALGLRARLALPVLGVSAFYVLSVAQLTGFVWHDMHLLWFTALLAVSPCADVLAVDSTRPLDAEGREYALPLLFVRLLFGVIYFFPGLHKLLESGLAWADPENLRALLYWKWAQHGKIPSFRLDLHPTWLSLGGLSVIAFELSFGPLVLFRKTRWVAVLAGLAFHLLCQALLFIPFASLWLCYVALLDLRPLAKRLARRKPAHPTASGAVTASAFVVPLSLVLGAASQGARGQMSSYPFACYPTFQWSAPLVMPDLRVVGVDRAGAAHELGRPRRGIARTQRQWAEIWSLAGVTAPVDRTRLAAYLEALRREGSEHAALTRARFYRVYRSVAPGRWDAPPVREQLLLDLELTR